VTRVGQDVSRVNGSEQLIRGAAVDPDSTLGEHGEQPGQEGLPAPDPRRVGWRRDDAPEARPLSVLLIVKEGVGRIRPGDGMGEMLEPTGLYPERDRIALNPDEGLGLWCNDSWHGYHQTLQSKTARQTQKHFDRAPPVLPVRHCL